MLYEQTIDASGVLQLDTAGRLFIIDSTGAAPSLDVEILRGGSPSLRLAGMARGLRLWFDKPFDGWRVTGAAGATVRVIIASEDVQIDTSNGATVTIDNTIAAPVPALLTLADTLNDAAPVAVADVAAVLLAASATRRGFRVYNAGANPVAIGGAAVVFANAAVILQAGDTWMESDAPGAAWKCICGAGLASTLNVLEQTT